MSVDKQLYCAAFSGDFDECVRLWKSGANINMAIMGASDPEEQSGAHKTIQKWSFENGAHLIFGMKHQQPTIAPGKSDSFFSRISMLRGPGDVAKGSFGQSNE